CRWPVYDIARSPSECVIRWVHALGRKGESTPKPRLKFAKSNALLFRQAIRVIRRRNNGAQFALPVPRDMLRLLLSGSLLFGAQSLVQRPADLVKLITSEETKRAWPSG